MGLTRRLGLLPLAWLLLFALLPYAVLSKVSVAHIDERAQPPFTSFVGAHGIDASADNFRLLISDPLYLQAYLGSLRIAGVATLLCLLIGFPLAYAIARADARWRLPLLMGIVLPFWTSFLIRVYAWMGLLNNNGLINQALAWTGLIKQPLAMLNTDSAVVFGIAYAYLPFMVLPLYAVLARLDVALLEAAADLGASNVRRFLRITLPLSVPGIIAGVLLVFIPAVGEFVIPDLLGGPQTLMIGKVLWTEFFINGDWPVASTVAVVMMIVLVAPLMLFDRYASRAT